jgi:MATE family multidrug resistance protein
LLAIVPLLLIVRGLIVLLPWLGIEPSVLALVVPYMEVSAWAIPSLLLFAALRRFLQALGIVRPIAFVVLVGNVLNLLLAMGLVLGFGPIPALGTVGSAWATLLSRTDLMLALAGIVVWHARRHAPRPMPALLAFDMDRVRRLVALGIPAAFQMTLEVGVFATATALVARLDVVSLSAHQIVIQVTTLTFVVTIGIGAAGAVLVGQSLGEGNPDRARTMGWMALVAGAAFMGCAALGFLLLGQAIVGAFTADPTVIQLGGTLLLVAAAFQLFDGLQAVATGILRGAGDTRTPMLTNLAGHWFLGLPLGYGLAFGLGHGVIGMWVGLSVGLMVVGVVLVTTWRHRARRLMPAFRAIDGAQHG